MFSYAYMKLFERRPQTYDKRLDRASSGHLYSIRETLVETILFEDDVPASDLRVLEMGCGTGELATQLALRDARVTGFDPNPEMLEVARQKVAEANVGDRVTLLEMGIERMDRLPDQRFDVVVASLVLSELSEQERRYALEQARRVLRPGGRLVLADEVVPRTRPARLVQHLQRMPARAALYLVSGRTPQPLSDPEDLVTKAGFSVVQHQRSRRDGFAVVEASTEERSVNEAA